MSKIEEKYGLKTGQAIALFAILVLNAIWFVCSFVFFSDNITSYGFWISSFMFVIAAFYACYAYKKPHGNLMRYLLLLYAASVAGFLVTSGKTIPMYLSINYAAIIILSTYMAGRLERYKQNVIISALILVGNCITTYYLFDIFADLGTLTFFNAVSSIGAITVWLAIAAGYIIRFKLHKEAGLTDK